MDDRQAADFGLSREQLFLQDNASEVSRLGRSGGASELGPKPSQPTQAITLHGAISVAMGLAAEVLKRNELRIKQHFFEDQGRLTIDEESLNYAAKIFLKRTASVR